MSPECSVRRPGRLVCNPNISGGIIIMTVNHAISDPCRYRIEVFGGVDTHKRIHVAAALDSAGRLLGTASFPAEPAGYEQLLEWLESFGSVRCVGVEGTGSYGAGLTRRLGVCGVEVLEVNRPNRQMRRRRGKTDTIDAEAAARAALNGDAAAQPKSRDGYAEAIRTLTVAKRSAVKGRTIAANQITAIIVTAPEQLRQRLEALSTTAAVKACLRLRPSTTGDTVCAAAKRTLRCLARRHQALTAEIKELNTELRRLCAQANPALLSAYGIGPDTAAALLIAAGDNPERLRNEASFAALCGASPVEASSGTRQRHRLNRGGNRYANNALWRIAMVRIRVDARSIDYVKRRTTEGKTHREILRCLKRYIAREIYKLITNPPYVPNGTDLRHQRTQHGLTLTTIASALNTTPTRISQLERSHNHNQNLAQRYHQHLTHNPNKKIVNTSCQKKEHREEPSNWATPTLL